MTTASCELCTEPIIGTAYVCPRCTRPIARRILTAAELYSEMTLVKARQVRYGEAPRLGNGEPAIPVNWDTVIDQGTVHNTMTTWAAHIAGIRGAKLPGNMSELIRWIGSPDQITWIRHRPDAEQILDELDYAARIVIRAVDAPREHWYAGPCNEDACTADLYARPDAETIRCHECGVVHDAGDRREWLLDQAEDHLGTATEIARLATAMRTVPVTAAQIRGLAHRGRITPHGVDRLQRATYRVGDVLDAVERIAA